MEHNNNPSMQEFLQLFHIHDLIWDFQWSSKVAKIDISILIEQMK